MKFSEKKSIIEWSKTLSNDELEKEYYRVVYDYSLGSRAERMRELDYDIADIKEQEKSERFIGQVTDLLEELCQKRGIELWKRKEDTNDENNV